jgi:DNA-directed RNA polymerase specialized sigma24 family protein
MKRSCFIEEISPMNSSDRTLIEKWTTRRDADAFAEIVSRYSGMVYATCLRILRNGSEAEEVAQECFLKLATGGTVIRSSLGG